MAKNRKLEIEFPRFPGVFPKAEEGRFPRLASRVSRPGAILLRWGLLIIAIDLAAEAAVALFRPAPGFSGMAYYAARTVKSLAILALGIPGIVCVSRAFKHGAALKAKGYANLGPTLPTFIAAMLFSPDLLSRVPPFTEIEHTPYNDPNDPDALLRMLDDLAAQMEINSSTG